MQYLRSWGLDQSSTDLAAKLEINAEPSGIAGLGLLLQLQAKVPKDKKILIVNTGKAKGL